MRAGKLRHRVTLQTKTDVQDLNGEVTPDYQSVGDVYAEIEPLGGREYFAAQQVQSEVSTRIRIRFRSGLDSTARVLHVRPDVTDTYDVVSVLEDKESGREFINLMCTKRVAEGFRRGDV